MAKTQTFGDKTKKKKIGDGRINVKVIKGYRTPEGNMRFMETFVKVTDIAEVEKIDITK
jgi:hypothetical protein